MLKLVGDTHNIFKYHRGKIAMLDYHLPKYLPSAEELLDSDETPVDNELQELIPALLKSILLMIWEQRMDWLFEIDQLEALGDALLDFNGMADLEVWFTANL